MFRPGPLTVLAALLTSPPVLAESVQLSIPLDCNFQTTCYIQQYVDLDPGPGVADFACGSLANDGHKGVDFALPSTAVMATGVTVTAAADGTVLNIRDGMADIPVNVAGAPDLAGRDCGNGVVIDHADGWKTQYCHLKNGSITVTHGQQVARGTPLGQVGLSGATTFPHLHLSVRKDGQVVDPFDPTASATCSAAPTDTLWDLAPTYRPGGFISVGFSDNIPEFEAIQAGDADRTAMSPTAPALVIWGYVFAGQRGDIVRFEITGPTGAVLTEEVRLEKSQPQLFRAVGRRTPPEGWTPGSYDGSVTLRRDNRVLDTRTTTLTIDS